MESTNGPLHLDKWSFVRWNIMDIYTSSIWIINFFDGAFEYGGISKVWGYVGTNAEIRFVELCNFALKKPKMSHYTPRRRSGGEEV
jgi:hypothetical protein